MGNAPQFEQELNTIPEKFPEVPDFDDGESVFGMDPVPIPHNEIPTDLYHIVLAYDIRQDITQVYTQGSIENASNTIVIYI